MQFLRWTVRAKAFRSVLDNYAALQETWDEAIEIVKDTETKARIGGISAQMKTFTFFFGVTLGELLLRHCDNLSYTLQKTDISAAQGQEVADLTLKTIKSLRSDENFQLFWENLLLSSKSLDLPEPSLPRKRKMPKRFESGQVEASFHTSPDQYFKQIYYEGLDLVINCVKDRFEQEGYKVYRHLQDVLLKTASHSDYSSDLDFILEFYNNDFEKKIKNKK